MHVFLTPLAERLLQRAYEDDAAREFTLGVVVTSPPQKGRAWTQAIRELGRKDYVIVHDLTPLPEDRILARISITETGRTAWLVVQGD